MVTRIQAKGDPSQVQPAMKGQPFNLSRAVVQTKSMEGAVFTLDCNSYTVESRVLALTHVREAAKAANVGTSKPVIFTVGELEESPEDVPLSPTTQAGECTVEGKWVEKGNVLRINLRKLFALRPFVVPKGTRAVIPVTTNHVQGLGPSFILRFSEVNFVPVEEGKLKARKAAKAAKAAHTAKTAEVPGQPAPSAPASSVPAPSVPAPSVPASSAPASSAPAIPPALTTVS